MVASLLESLLPNVTLSTVASSVVGFCANAGLAVTDWALGSVASQTFAAYTNGIYSYSQIINTVIRGFGSLLTSTDPGDVDPYNPNNQNLPWSPGFLSVLGQGTYGTTREGPTFAPGTATLLNSSGGGINVFPDTLVFTSSGAGFPTYRNSPDASIYTNTNGSVTIAPSASLVVPVEAEVAGSSGSANANALSLTTVVNGLSCTASSAIVGQNVEPAGLPGVAGSGYRARCAQAMSRLSLNGPGSAYQYLAARDINGNALVVDPTTGALTTINRVYVSQSSTNGTVTLYYANPSGPCSDAERDAANSNIALQALAVAGAITLLPYAPSPPGIPGGAEATAKTIDVTGTAKLKLNAGNSVAAAQLAMNSPTGSTAAFLSQAPIGGYDQTAGIGVIYTEDLAYAAQASYPGLYGLAVSVPSGSSTTIALGHVPVAGTIAWTVTGT